MRATGPAISIRTDPASSLLPVATLPEVMVLPETVWVPPGVMVTATAFPSASKALTVTMSR